MRLFANSLHAFAATSVETASASRTLIKKFFCLTSGFALSYLVPSCRGKQTNDVHEDRESSKVSLLQRGSLALFSKRRESLEKPMDERFDTLERIVGENLHTEALPEVLRGQRYGLVPRGDADDLDETIEERRVQQQVA